MERMHTQDLRAIVAAICASTDAKIDHWPEAIKEADSLMTELAKPEVKDYKDRDLVLGLRTRAEAAEARLAEARIERDGARVQLNAANQQRDDARSERDTAAARAQGLEEEVRASIDLIPSAFVVRVCEGGGPESLPATLAVSIAKLASRFKAIMENSPLLAELRAAQDRLAGIDAAKAGEPPMPTRFMVGLGFTGFIENLEGWGRQGWDAAAALRVDLAEAEVFGAEPTAYINKHTALAVGREREKWAGLVQELLNMDDTPEPNCSCHLSPPCEDCVEHAGKRELIASLRTALKAHQEAAK